MEGGDDVDGVRIPDCVYYSRTLASAVAWKEEYSGDHVLCDDEPPPPCVSAGIGGVPQEKRV
jgi:hypothetical protein